MVLTDAHLLLWPLGTHNLCVGKSARPSSALHSIAIWLVKWFNLPTTDSLDFWFIFIGLFYAGELLRRNNCTRFLSWCLINFLLVLSCNAARNPGKPLRAHLALNAQIIHDDPSMSFSFLLRSHEMPKCGHKNSATPVFSNLVEFFSAMCTRTIKCYRLLSSIYIFMHAAAERDSL